MNIQVRNIWSLPHKKIEAARNIIHHYGPARKFRKFEASIHPETWCRHDELLAWAEAQAEASAETEADHLYQKSDDPVVRQGFDLVHKAKRYFKNRCRQYDQIRMLIHVPPAVVSSAGFSLFTNFIQSFRFLGLTVQELGWSDDTRSVLEQFQPTVLLTADHSGYLSQIDWEAVRHYRKSHILRVGLQAWLQEYGTTPLPIRLKWARQNDIDFYYSFRSPQYVKERYREFFDNGYQVFNLEFGANPLIYYPVPGIKRDLNYVFLGSTNPDKWPRYYSYFKSVLTKYPGYIDGPWWKSISKFGGSETHRYLCARARVGLNLHIQTQIDWACELNERTYNLAACGIPQLIDTPKLLFNRFHLDSFFVANSPAEYESLFNLILRAPEEAQRRALQAQREVFANHTIFHRSESFVRSLIDSGICKHNDSNHPEKSSMLA